MFYTFVFVIASINHLINELCSFYSSPLFAPWVYFLFLFPLDVEMTLFDNLFLVFFDEMETITQSNVATAKRFRSVCMLDRTMKCIPNLFLLEASTAYCEHEIAAINSFKRHHFAHMFGNDFSRIFRNCFASHIEKPTIKVHWLVGACVHAQWHFGIPVWIWRHLKCTCSCTHKMNVFKTFQMNIKERMY